MTIATVVVQVEWNPVEVQAWLDANPTAAIRHISTHDNLVYIFYE